MRVIRFNHFERVAGVFVLSCIVAGVMFLFSLAIKQGWFERKIAYITHFETADGVHPGTQVQISGLRVGTVTDVELRPDNKIEVNFEVISKFQVRIREDSVVELVRPFVIGDRILDITVGSEQAKILPEHSVIKSKENTDLLSVLSGKKLGPYLAMLGSLVENVKFLAESLLEKGRTEAMVRMFDRLDPLLVNLNTMSLEVTTMAKQANEDENLGRVLADVSKATHELNRYLPAISEAAPQVGRNLVQLVDNLSVLTKEFKVVLPALAEVAPDLPAASRRSLEALDEAVVLIKAMQKNLFVRGSVKEVRDEEANDAAEFNRQRKPASTEEH